MAKKNATAAASRVIPNDPNDEQNVVESDHIPVHNQSQSQVPPTATSVLEGLTPQQMEQVQQYIRAEVQRLAVPQRPLSPMEEVGDTQRGETFQRRPDKEPMGAPLNPVRVGIDRGDYSPHRTTYHNDHFDVRDPMPPLYRSPRPYHMDNTYRRTGREESVHTTDSRRQKY
jgi:hypothetical protein